MKASLLGHPLLESTAFFGKSESGLWDAAAACLSLSPQHVVISPPGAKSSLPGHPLCLGEKPGCACGNSLKERDTLSLRSPEASLGKAQHVAPGEKRRSIWPCCGETVVKQASLPWQEEQAGGKTSVTLSLCRENEA